MRNKDTYFLAGSRILTFCCDIIINTGYEILLAAWLFPDVAVSLYIFLLELYRVNIVAIFNTEYLAFLIVLIIMCPPPPHIRINGNSLRQFFSACNCAEHSPGYRL